MSKADWFNSAPRSETVEVPGLGPVTIRELSLAERIAIEREAAKEGAPSRIALLCAGACRDVQGAPVFTPEEAHLIDKMPARRAGDLTARVASLNAMAADSEEEALKN